MVKKYIREHTVLSIAFTGVYTYNKQAFMSANILMTRTVDLLACMC